MVFTLLSWIGGIMVIVGILLIGLCFILTAEEGPYKPDKHVLFGNSINNLIAGLIIGIIGFFILCFEGQFFPH